MNLIIFLFPDIPTAVSLTSLLSRGRSPLLRLPTAMAEACHKHAAEGKSHGYLLGRGALPRGHLDTLLWPWESQVHRQPQLPMAAEFIPAPACSPNHSCRQWGHPTLRTCLQCLQHLLCKTAAHLHCCPPLRPPLPLRHTSMKCHYAKLSFFCSLLKPDRAWLCFHVCNLQFNPQEM